ncbi:MAG: hypothetical protein R3A49_11050 [Acidimicrobiia bacterium]
MFERLREQYGLKAWWGAFVMRSEMKHLGGLVEETYVPILRLMDDDPDRIERDHRAVTARRNEITWWDSPYARWKKTYGNFVREFEWASGELEARMSQPDFEDLIVSTLGGRMENWVGWVKRLLRRLDERSPEGIGSAMSGSRATEINARSMATMWPIVGDIEIRGVDDGVIECYIPDCAMHKVVSDTEPQTNACLYGCKATCEAFLGPEVPMSIHFEPNLPAFDCVMRVSMDGRPADPARRAPRELDLSST